MALVQPPEPVSDFLILVVILSVPSPPLKVPAVAVSVSPTTAEPVSAGVEPFLWDQLVALVALVSLYLACLGHKANDQLQQSIRPVLLEQWSVAGCFGQSALKQAVFRWTNTPMDLNH